MSRRRHALLPILALLLGAGAAHAQGTPDTARAGRRPTAETVIRAIARDRVGAADTTCDDLCRRERMMDSIYGKDRERRPAPPAKPAAAPKLPTKKAPTADA